MDFNREETLRIFKKALSIMVRKSQNNLENVASFLDDNFELGVKELPEYKTAIDAIEKYKKKVIEKFESGYNSKN